MADKIKLSVEEKAILLKLNNDQLRFLTQIDDHKDKERLVEVIHLLIGREKEMFFQENSAKLDSQKLFALHNLARGNVMAYVTFWHLVRAARYELERRSKEGKK